MLIVINIHPVRMATEASFIAEDPWNQNTRASFTLDSYLMLRVGASPSGSERLSNYCYGLQGGVANGQYMLPDSLSAMWRAHRIPSEALPRLLKQMRPALIKSDYRPILANSKGYLILCWVLGCVMGLFTLSPFAIWLLTGEFSLSFAAYFSLSLGLFSAFSLYLLYFRVTWRRTRQIKWILSQ